MTDAVQFITMNRDFLKNRFEAITTVNMETSATQDKETAQRRKEILMTKKTDVSGCLITFWPLTGLLFGCARCPPVPNFCCQGTRKSEFLHTNNNYAGHPRVYRVRTLSCLQFSSEHSLDLLTSSSSSSHSSLLMVDRTNNVKINEYTPHPSVKDKQQSYPYHLCIISLLPVTVTPYLCFLHKTKE